MRISDWSSDVCSSDLQASGKGGKTCEVEQLGGQVGVSIGGHTAQLRIEPHILHDRQVFVEAKALRHVAGRDMDGVIVVHHIEARYPGVAAVRHQQSCQDTRSEEHTSELQSLMRISYAVFCLKKKNKT